jgi:hypothetical protein
MSNAKEAGMSVVVQTVVTHENAQTPQIREMAKFATENDYTVDILVARATGAWEGRYDMLITPEDEACPVPGSPGVPGPAPGCLARLRIGQGLRGRALHPAHHPVR